ncbi:MAG: DUF3343 domain-containing protein [Paenibacillaceae bacterium]|nr:DUF3343 domain-containing protein [Paenibacillaceae bacterium]
MILICFDSTHHAIHCEMVLDDAGIESDTLPTPKAIAAGCALSIAISVHDEGRVRTILTDQRVHTFGLFYRDGGSYVRREDG